MSIRETSKSAYEDVQEEGGVSRQQKAVLEKIPEGRDFSLQELSKITGFPINVISGRVNELKKKG
ncbi:MAG TPA: hypothetical protein VIY47_01520, partial [Ignavibacteriaceae bacterium]